MPYPTQGVISPLGPSNYTVLPLAPPRITIARSIVDSVDIVAIAVRHHGADYLMAVSIERSDLDAADVLMLPDPAMAQVVSIAAKAGDTAFCAAIRARAREDYANYNLLSAVPRAPRGYAFGWTEALCEDAGREVVAAV